MNRLREFERVFDPHARKCVNVQLERVWAINIVGYIEKTQHGYG